MKLKCFSQGEEEILNLIADDGQEMQVVNIYPNVPDQVFEGFGGAITDAASYVFSLMNQNQKDKLTETYFGSKGMNYRMVRIPIDSCDFSRHMYAAVQDETDEELESFSFETVEMYILPMLEAAQEKSDTPLEIMLSAWSPPAFMKTNHQRTQGGHLKTEYRKRWADYICRYIQEFEKRGYPIKRMTIQNEPKASQTWDSCIYTSEEEREFLERFLDPSLKEHGLDKIEVFIWDHNKERLFERACEVITPSVDPMVDGIAFHWYSGDHFEALDIFRRQFPNKKLILSESCLEFRRFDKTQETTNAERLAHDMIGNLNHGMNAFYDWNLLLDSQGGPNHVGNFCEAPFMYDIAKGRLEEKKSLSYYKQFASFIKPGAIKVCHSTYTSDLEVTAFKNPDGGLVIVFLNRSDEILPCFLRIEGKMAKLTFEPHSILTASVID